MSNRRPALWLGLLATFLLLQSPGSAATDTAVPSRVALGSSIDYGSETKCQPARAPKGEVKLVDQDGCQVVAQFSYVYPPNKFGFCLGGTERSVRDNPNYPNVTLDGVCSAYRLGQPDVPCVPTAGKRRRQVFIWRGGIPTPSVWRFQCARMLPPAAPVARPDTWGIRRERTLSRNVLANDQDPNGGALQAVQWIYQNDKKPPGLTTSRYGKVTWKVPSGAKLRTWIMSYKAYAGGQWSKRVQVRITVLKARYRVEVRRLVSQSVNLTTEGGRVVSKPSNLRCGDGATCSATFRANATVILTPRPAAGWRFTDWSGDCSKRRYARKCMLKMTRDHFVDAKFYRMPTVTNIPTRFTQCEDKHRCRVVLPDVMFDFFLDALDLKQDRPFVDDALSAACVATDIAGKITAVKGIAKNVVRLGVQETLGLEIVKKWFDLILGTDFSACGFKKQYYKVLDYMGTPGNGVTVTWISDRYSSTHCRVGFQIDGDTGPGVFFRYPYATALGECPELTELAES